MKTENWFRLTPAKMILLGYFVIVNLGACLLSLPIATQAGIWTPYLESLFTATSATCVTGLVLHTTATYWSIFGQLIILVLIQIGGMGFFTMAIMLSVLAKRKISLRQRHTMQESINAPMLGGIVRMARFVFLGTLAIEGLGALVLSLRFIPQFGWGYGIYYAVFHSISAFCNAGFDLFGMLPEGGSLMAFVDDPVVNVTIMLLIVIGGLGFFVWADVRDHRQNFAKYRLHSKLVLGVSAVLIVVPAVMMFFMDANTAAYAGLSPLERAMAVLFQSVTTRTAGFNSVDLTQISASSQSLMLGLMLVGGSSGSTAGGMKTTTLIVLLLCVRASFTRSEDLNVFGRRIDDQALRSAVTIFVSFCTLFISAALVLHHFDGISFAHSLFETASAVATVGLSLGATPHLSSVSQLAIIFLMFFGRVGCLTMVYAIAEHHSTGLSRLPVEQIAIG